MITENQLRSLVKIHCPEWMTDQWDRVRDDAIVLAKAIYEEAKREELGLSAVSIPTVLKGLEVEAGVPYQPYNQDSMVVCLVVSGREWRGMEKPVDIVTDIMNEEAQNARVRILERLQSYREE
jgi:hypothetical protein